MKERLAKYISGISSPFLMVVVFGMWSVAASVRTFQEFLLYGGLCLGLIAVMPFIYILINIKLGRITDMHVAVREQRAMPFVVATFGAVLLAMIYNLINAPRELIALAITLVVSGIVFGLISQFWKISVHAASFTGAVIIVAFLINVELLWLLIFLPAVIWARLIRKRHSPEQAILASLLNAVCVSTTLALLLR